MTYTLRYYTCAHGHTAKRRIADRVRFAMKDTRVRGQNNDDKTPRLRARSHLGKGKELLDITRSFFSHTYIYIYTDLDYVLHWFSMRVQYIIHSDFRQYEMSTTLRPQHVHA